MSEIPAMFCLVDGEPIVPARVLRRSVTCSVECAKKLVAMRRAMIDARVCRQCHAPSTPEERKDFQRWRRDRGHVKMGRPKSDPGVAYPVVNSKASRTTPASTEKVQ